MTPLRRAQKCVALVVGISRYRHVAALASPGHDAAAMAGFLESAGFDLVAGGACHDLDRNGLVAAIAEFEERIKGGDVAVFYFSGHGMAIEGTSYLLPVDALPQSPRQAQLTAVPADSLLDAFGYADNKFNILIMDACRLNQFGGMGFKLVEAGLTRMQIARAPRGTIIAYATQPGHAALDGPEGEPSHYTAALLKAMARPGRSIHRVFDDAAIEVERLTNGDQRPWIERSPIRGDFQFIPRRRRNRNEAESPLPAPEPAPPAVPEAPLRSAERPTEQGQAAGLLADATSSAGEDESGLESAAPEGVSAPPNRAYALPLGSFGTSDAAVTSSAPISPASTDLAPAEPVRRLVVEGADTPPTAGPQSSAPPVLAVQPEPAKASLTPPVPEEAYGCAVLIGGAIALVLLYYYSRSILQWISFNFF